MSSSPVANDQTIDFALRIHCRKGGHGARAVLGVLDGAVVLRLGESAQEE